MNNLSRGRVANFSYYAPILYIALFLALWVLAFFQALESAVDLWYASKTYNHCFIVLPLAIYFVWLHRDEILTATPRCNIAVLIPLLLIVVVWAMGYGGDVQLLTHIAAFSSLPLTVWYCVGNQAAKRMWFPLVLVLFCIPVGEGLVPWFQNLTADLSVAMLRLSNVPVYRDGLYISIPNGKFEVVEACSGIRFFISTITLGFVYAYVNYQSFVRRILFILASILVPILANGVRAFGIMLVGHLSDMEYAAGADHVIYGWIFFLFVLVLLFLIGNLWSEKRPKNKKTEKLKKEKLKNFTIDEGWNNNNWSLSLFVIFIPMIAIILWRQIIDSAYVNQNTKINNEHIVLVNGDNNSWLPAYEGATDIIQGKILSQDELDVFVAWFPTHGNGHELISWGNRIFRPDHWSIKNQQYIAIETPLSSFEANLVDIRNSVGQRRLVLYWYEVPERKGGREVSLKFQQAINVLTGNSGAGGVIAISREYDIHDSNADANLTTLVAKYYPKVSNMFPF